jgi:molybdate transport system permease protein
VKRLQQQRALLIALGGVLVAFLLLPLLALFATSSPQDVWSGMGNPLVWPALRLSIVSTCASLLLVVVFGTPLAYCLARAHGRLAQTVETLVQLPIVIPPAVAGLALLLAFGRRGLVAEIAHTQTWSLSFTTAAVVMAQLFVSAPFFVQAALSAFRRVDPNLVLVARSLGASPLRVFGGIALPLALPGLIAGAAMSWARALGEFGATLMFAGNLEGQTQTLPLAIYVALESDLRAAQAIALILVVVAFALLIVVRAAFQRAASGEQQT